MKTQLSDIELWQCLSDADERKSDSTLPIDVRVRSFETYARCLREAANRGYDYAGLKAHALEQVKYRSGLIAWINSHDCGVTPTAIERDGRIVIRVEAVHADGSVSIEETTVTNYAQARDALGY